MPLFSDYASTRKTVLQKTVNKPVHRRIQGGGHAPFGISTCMLAKWQNGEFYNTLRV